MVHGNSDSGTSSVAASLRERFGRGLIPVGQDNLPRIVLRERDRPGAANIGLIDLTARYALDAGFHVVVEHILYADRYGDMLAQLRADHRGPTHGYYLDVPFGETRARHATTPIADDVNETQLRDGYRTCDLLPGGIGALVQRSSETGAHGVVKATVSLGSLPLSRGVGDFTGRPLACSWCRVSAKEDRRAVRAAILLRIASRSETGRQGPSATRRPSR